MSAPPLSPARREKRIAPAGGSGTSICKQARGNRCIFSVLAAHPRAGPVQFPLAYYIPAVFIGPSSLPLASTWPRDRRKDSASPFIFAGRVVCTRASRTWNTSIHLDALKRSGVARWGWRRGRESMVMLLHRYRRLLLLPRGNFLPFDRLCERRRAARPHPTPFYIQSPALRLSRAPLSPSPSRPLRPSRAAHPSFAFSQRVVFFFRRARQVNYKPPVCTDSSAQGAAGIFMGVAACSTPSPLWLARSLLRASRSFNPLVTEIDTYRVQDWRVRAGERKRERERKGDAAGRGYARAAHTRNLIKRRLNLSGLRFLIELPSCE